MILYFIIIKTGLSCLQDLIENKSMQTRLLTSLFVISALHLTSGCTFIHKKTESRRLQEQKSAAETPNFVSSPEDDPVVIQIRSYEKQLSSKREKEHYSKILPWFKSDQERLTYLQVGSFTEKQQWALDQRIWNRANSPTQEMKTMIVTSDIAIGMPMDYVIKSWGEPMAREISGNPYLKNEKWKYSRNISTRDGYKKENRLVYFEGGRVVGWETE